MFLEFINPYLYRGAYVKEAKVRPLQREMVVSFVLRYVKSLSKQVSAWKTPKKA